MPPRQITSMVNGTYNSMRSMKQIYNETVKIIRERVGAMKPMKWAMVEAKKLGYFTTFTLGEARRVRNIFIVTWR